MAAKDSTRGTLSANELSAFCAQLALITKAGIPAQEGISIMMEDAGDVRTRELMQSVLNKLEEGAPLHKACLLYTSYLVTAVAWVASSLVVPCST